MFQYFGLGFKFCVPFEQVHQHFFFSFLFRNVTTEWLFITRYTVRLVHPNHKKTIFSCPLEVSSHTDSFSIIWPGFLAPPKYIRDWWNFICGAPSVEKIYSKILQQHLFPETMSCLLWVIHRPHCKQFLLEPMTSEDRFTVKLVTACWQMDLFLVKTSLKCWDSSSKWGEQHCSGSVFQTTLLLVLCLYCKADWAKYEVKGERCEYDMQPLSS